MSVTKRKINLLDVYTFLYVRDSQIRCLPEISMIMLTFVVYILWGRCTGPQTIYSRII